MQWQCSGAGKEDEDILIKDDPQIHVPTIESLVYSANPLPDFSDMPSPRLLHTHLPYSILPDSIKKSECKIVYITRNLKDTFVSLWHFLNAICRANQQPIPLEKAFECFCNGVYLHGPFFDHVLQFWTENLRRPHKILFLKYEELKRDPKGQVKRLASFLGRPFAEEEEVDKLLWRCSLDRLKNLEVNKNGDLNKRCCSSSLNQPGAMASSDPSSAVAQIQIIEIKSLKSAGKTGLRVWQPYATESPDSVDVLLNKLSKERFWEVTDIYQWEGVWLARECIEAAIAFRSHFEARDDDVILASTIKSGTTWLKALCLCIMQSQINDDAEKEEEDILVKYNPHVCVQTVEAHTYMINPNPDLSGMPSPRLFHTHLHYNVLPDSIKNSKCKIVYITRNPKDALVSLWHHFNTMFRPNQEPFPLEKGFECFCNGVTLFGPFFDNVLQYWTQSLKMPHKILFLKYEELKKDPKTQLKRLASFLGRPFGNEEEVDKMLWRCSLERLKNLEVNKSGSSLWTTVPNSIFFRVGIVGGWKNYLTSEMEERLDQITRERLEGSGLELDV
ncbi:hypothetical protein F0562_031428 [Nyssa sinensis]|uniref:Sulfotransferase n=1 Tax=Nyssa sinensis TaxID=561372 RepID=A0A5J5AY69_9ASTE|nr:hypothetical protein F0562_031428 [Nyssa sinensis]